MARPLPCCVDVPAAGALVRYGLEELLRGIGLEAQWTRRGDAALVVALEGAQNAGHLLVLEVTAHAVADLEAGRIRDLEDMGYLDIEGERWPVPVGPSGLSTLGDAVAGAAWWLAGIQESATVERDRHGRYPYAASLQSALEGAPGGPLRPAVDAYRRALESALASVGLEAERPTWGRASWAVVLSHDLDAVRTRRVRAGLGSLRRGRVLEAGARAFGPDRRRQSILDLEAVSARHEAAATWFVKPGAWTPEDIPGGLDPWLVDTLSSWRPRGHEIGWHPGYGTAGRPDRLEVERARFESAFGVHPDMARTHFLRWAEPDTPRALSEAGVRVDSTLGFAEHEGFRRATSHPFRVFDLEADSVTELWEVPLSVMDTTLTDYRGVDDLEGAILRVFEAAKGAGGVAVVLWHNQVGGETAAWRSRLDALDRALGQAQRRGAAVGALESLLRSWNQAF